MKWLWRALLVLCLIPFFLPDEGRRELRNLPLLIFICLFFLLCITYRLVCMHLLYRKVRNLLLQGGYTVERPRMYLYSAFLLAKRGEERLSLCLVLRKHRYYRYHFASVGQIEFWITSFFAAANKRGLSIRRGAILHSMLGGQSLRWPETDPDAPRLIVMDRLPCCVTDASPESGELAAGDTLLRGEATLLTPEGLSEHLSKRSP